MLKQLPGSCFVMLSLPSAPRCLDRKTRPYCLVHEGPAPPQQTVHPRRACHLPLSTWVLTVRVHLAASASPISTYVFLSLGAQPTHTSTPLLWSSAPVICTPIILSLARAWTMSCFSNMPKSRNRAVQSVQCNARDLSWRWKHSYSGNLGHWTISKVTPWMPDSDASGYHHCWAVHSPVGFQVIWIIPLLRPAETMQGKLVCIKAFLGSSIWVRGEFSIILLSKHAFGCTICQDVNTCDGNSRWNSLVQRLTSARQSAPTLPVTNDAAVSYACPRLSTGFKGPPQLCTSRPPVSWVPAWPPLPLWGGPAQLLFLRHPTVW